MSDLLSRYRATGKAPTAAEKVAGITDLEELEAFRASFLSRGEMTDDLHTTIRERERELKK